MDAVRAKTAADIIEVAPTILGFEPTDSVVVIGLVRGTRRVGPTMRFDTGHLHADPPGVVAALRAVAKHCDDVIVVHFSDHPVAAALMPDVADAADTAGLLVVAGLWATADRYGDLLDEDGSSHPRAGATSHVVTAAVVAGHTTAPDRAGLWAPAPTDADRRAAFSAYARMVPPGVTLDDDARMAPFVEAVSNVVNGRPVDADLYGRMGRTADRLDTRDNMIAYAVHAGAGWGGSFVDAMFGGTATPGDLARQTVGLLHTAAQHHDSTTAAHLYVAAGTLAWWCGDGARANDALVAALAHDPGNTLAGLLDRTLRAGIAPGWVAAGL